MSGFETAFDRLISNEGGYVFHSADPGGETNWGISKRSYPDLNIKALTREDAKSIYQRDFWLKGQMDQFDFAIAFQAFDAAVNHGISRAIKLLQQAAGAVPDGVIGAQTVKAIHTKSVTDMLLLIIAYRIKYWTSLPTWNTFGRGWANRAADDLIFAALDS